MTSSVEPKFEDCWTFTLKLKWRRLCNIALEVGHEFRSSSRFSSRFDVGNQAVRIGNYYAEDQEEVFRYIAQAGSMQAESSHVTSWSENEAEALESKMFLYVAEVYGELLSDDNWRRKNKSKVQKENGFTRP